MRCSLTRRLPLSVSLVPHPSLSTFTAPPATGANVYRHWAAQNHMVIMPDADLEQAADALMGAAYGSAGERCMAISVAVAVGDRVADALVERLKKRVANLKSWTGNRSGGRDGASGHPRTPAEGACLCGLGVEEGADLVVDGRDLRIAGNESGFFWAGVCSTGSPAGCASTARRSSARYWSWYGPGTSKVRSSWSTIMSTATEQPSSPATGRLPAATPHVCRSAWSVSMCRSLYPWLTTVSADGNARCSAISMCTVWKGSILYQTENRNFALANRRQSRRGFSHACDEIAQEDTPG